jgi:hypothetical protein
VVEPGFLWGTGTALADLRDSARTSPSADRQAQETRAAVPRPHRPGRQPDLDLLRPARRRQRDHRCPPRPPDRPAVRRRARRPRRPRLHRPRPRPRGPLIITGWKSTSARKTTPAQRPANQALSAARAPVEHGFSDLKNWRIITRLRLDPAKATMLCSALLVLTRQHTTRWQTIMTYAHQHSLARAPPVPPTPAP